MPLNEYLALRSQVDSPVYYDAAKKLLVTGKRRSNLPKRGQAVGTVIRYDADTSTASSAECIGAIGIIGLLAEQAERVAAACAINQAMIERLGI